MEDTQSSPLEVVEDSQDLINPIEDLYWEGGVSLPTPPKSILITRNVSNSQYRNNR